MAKREVKKLYYFTTLEGGTNSCVASDVYGTLAEAEEVASRTAKEIKQDVYINEGEDIVGAEYYFDEEDRS